MKTKLCSIAAGGIALALLSGGCQVMKNWGLGDKPELIKRDPQSVVAMQDQKVAFSAIADRNYTDTLQYQWLFNGKNIPGATNAVFEIEHARKADVGFYSCAVKAGAKKGTPPPPPEVSSPASLSFMSTNATGSSVSVPGFFKLISGSGGTCPGQYYGWTRFTNTAVTPKSQWFTRPANTTQCTATDLSPYATKVEAFETPSTAKWCGPEGVTFPTKAPPTNKYKFTTYFTVATNLPVAGEVILLDLNWF